MRRLKPIWGFDILLFGVYAQLNTRISPSLSPNLSWVFLEFSESQTKYGVEKIIKAEG